MEEVSRSQVELEHLVLETVHMQRHIGIHEDPNGKDQYYKQHKLYNNYCKTTTYQTQHNCIISLRQGPEWPGRVITILLQTLQGH